MKDSHLKDINIAIQPPEYVATIIKELRDMPVFLTIREVGSILRMSKPKVYSYIHQKGFPLIQIDRKLLVCKNEFIKWLKTKTIN